MYVQRRKGRVLVYYYDKEKGHPVQLPRSQTKELDNLSDDEIRVWLERQPGHMAAVDRTSRRVAFQKDKVADLITQFQAERKHEGIGARSLENEHILFYSYILPYFVGEHSAKDVKKWRMLGGGLKAYLIEHTTLSVKVRRQVVQTVNRFGRWLRDNNFIEDVWDFRSSSRQKVRSITPLPRECSPEEILEALKKIEEPVWKIMVLVGYFGCLRPEESFALEKQDFLTSDQAVKESSTYERLQKVGLGSKLAAVINKALVKNKQLGPPKNFNSNGVVTIWHAEAAKLLGKLLRDMPEGKLIDFNKRHCFRLFKKQVSEHIFNLTPHDLRRSSGLYLGRTVGLEPFLLQDVMRLADLETVQIYTRRPITELSASGQDFDDVV